MELLQYDHQHYILKSDLTKRINLTDQHFHQNVESYTFSCKPLDCVELNGQSYIACKSACHFLNWYMDTNYRLMPNISSFRHELAKFGTKIPKRVLSRAIRYELAYRQKYKCNHCEVLLSPTFEVDHIVALEDGGHDIAKNLQCLCVPCHKDKTRLNRLRKHPLFAREAEAQHQTYVHEPVARAESSDDETQVQVFSKYFSTQNTQNT